MNLFHKTSFSLSLLAVFSFMMVACGDDEPIDKLIHVNGVSFNPNELTISKDEQTQLDVVVSPTNATDKTYSLASSDVSIVTISPTGLITAVSEGTAIITVKTTDGGFTDKCIVKVIRKPVNVIGVKVEPKELNLTEGNTAQLEIVVLPDDATNKSYTISSSNPDVATVSETGLVTAVAEGSSFITIKTNDGGYTDKCSINVISNAWTVVKDGQIHTYPIKSATVYYSQNSGCSLLFVDKEFSVTTPLYQEPPSNWCTIDIPLGDWDFYLATSDCRPKSYYVANELSSKKQSFSGPSSKGEYTLKFTCHIPADKIDISINYKGIPQTMDEYFWRWGNNELIGAWECISFQGYPISKADEHIYVNYADRSGYMEAYDEFGVWTSFPYRWRTTDRHSIVIDWNYAFGAVTAEYFYDFDHGLLYLTDPGDPNRWWQYRRI